MSSERVIPSLRAPLRATAFALSTLARLGAVSLHQSLVGPEQQAAVFDRHMRSWCRRLLRLFGVRVLVNPCAPPAATGARLVVANHRSPADIIALLTIFGGQFLGQDAIARWPIIGPAARKAGTVFVQRERGASGASAIRTMRRRLQQGATLLVFPEGTTFSGDEVHPFRAGALIALRGLNVEIVPVGLAYDPGTEWLDESFLSHLQRIAKRKTNLLAIQIGDPLRLTPNADLAEVTSQLQNTVQSLVHQAREAHCRASTDRV